MEKRAMAVREEQWLQTIAAAKQSGQPIKVWCAEHGVPLSSFYKWQRKMRDSLLAEEKAEIQFQELEVPQNICGTATSGSAAEYMWYRNFRSNPLTYPGYPGRASSRCKRRTDQRSYSGNPACWVTSAG